MVDETIMSKALFGRSLKTQKKRRKNPWHESWPMARMLKRFPHVFVGVHP